MLEKISGRLFGLATAAMVFGELWHGLYGTWKLTAVTAYASFVYIFMYQLWRVFDYMAQYRSLPRADRPEVVALGQGMRLVYALAVVVLGSGIWIEWQFTAQFLATGHPVQAFKTMLSQHPHNMVLSQIPALEAMILSFVFTIIGSRQLRLSRDELTYLDVNGVKTFRRTDIQSARFESSQSIPQVFDYVKIEPIPAAGMEPLSIWLFALNQLERMRVKDWFGDRLEMGSS